MNKKVVIDATGSDLNADWIKTIGDYQKQDLAAHAALKSGTREKHLPGQHDQASHGSWATGGDVEGQSHPYRQARPVVTAGQVSFDDFQVAPPSYHQPNGSKISDKLRINGLKAGHEQIVREAISAIDRVNGDGELPVIKIVPSGAKLSSGTYHYKRKTFPDGHQEILESVIRVKEDADYPLMNTVHEIGHFIDHRGLGNAVETFDYINNALNYEDSMVKVEIPSEVRRAGKALYEAIYESKSYQTLTKMIRSPSSLVGTNSKGEKLRFALDKKFVVYLRKPAEIFARAYAQYVALRSGHPALLAELNAARSRPTLSTDFISPNGFNITAGFPYDWDDNDFEPIADAMDNYLRVLGWIK
jgi:hypothetical protein